MEPWVREALEHARHGVLVTRRADGWPRPVPFTFALVGHELVSAVDHKPKTTTRLARLADIEREGRASVLVEHYSDDWSQLWWIRIAGRATLDPPEGPARSAAIDALVATFPQYLDRPPAGPTYRIALDDVLAWRAGGEGATEEDIVQSN